MLERRLQVFVSSTYTDMLAERQACVQAILRAGHIPAGMELFTAGDQSQLEVIKRWIDDSDVFVLLLGGRYGSIEPTSGMSYTELEYRHALEKAKPSFAIVIDPNALNGKVKEMGPAAIEQHEPKKLVEFKALVTSRICSFFADDKDIRLAVTESLQDVARQVSSGGWVRGESMEVSASLQKLVERLTSENEALKSKIAAFGEHSNEDEIGRLSSVAIGRLKRYVLGEVGTFCERDILPGTTALEAFKAVGGSLSLGIEVFMFTGSHEDIGIRSDRPLYDFLLQMKLCGIVTIDIAPSGVLVGMGRKYIVKNTPLGDQVLHVLSSDV